MTSKTAVFYHKKLPTNQFCLKIKEICQKLIVLSSVMYGEQYPI